MTDDVTGDALTLERFLREVPMLDAQQLLEIAAAHEHVGREVLQRAREAAGEVARADGLLDELQALQGTIVQWTSASLADSRRYTLEAPLDTPILGDLREQARTALLDAATALFLVDRLPPDDRAALLGPVDSVIG